MLVLKQVCDHTTMPCASSFREMVAHQPQCIKLKTTVPGITQPLAGKSEAAPSLDGKEHFKAYSTLLFDSDLLSVYKSFLFVPVVAMFIPQTFNSGLFTKCFPSSGNYIYNTKQTLAR